MMHGISKAKIRQFQQTIWNFYSEHKRELPWRKTKNPYEILVSEIMLQQTQVSRVLEKYPQFLARFPDVTALAKAAVSEVIMMWQGLGYNRRALALKRTAECIIASHKGKIPIERGQLETLDGIGPYTAGALRCFAYGIPESFIETNIRRVFLHEFMTKKKGVTDSQILKLVALTLDKQNPREWYYALMDYGAHLGKVLRKKNPNRKSAHYAKQSKFQASHRQLRGAVLRLLANSKKKKARISKITAEIFAPKKKIEQAILELSKEGFLKENKSTIELC